MSDPKDKIRQVADILAKTIAEVQPIFDEVDADPKGMPFTKPNGRQWSAWTSIENTLHNLEFQRDYLLREIGEGADVVHSYFLCPPKESKPVMTYLMRDNKTLLYKIGKSVDPYQRHKELRCGNPQIELIGLFDTDVESELHQKYKDKRHKGEWFKLSEQDVSDIFKKEFFYSPDK